MKQVFISWLSYGYQQFLGKGWERLRAVPREDVVSLPSDTLGMFPNLYGKGYLDIGKFLEHYYGCPFLAIFAFLFLSFSRVGDWSWQQGLPAAGMQMESLDRIVCGRKGRL